MPEKLIRLYVYILSYMSYISIIVFQAFRDMNAYSAIEFVFKTKFTVCNIDSSKFVRQETLVRNG